MFFNLLADSREALKDLSSVDRLFTMFWFLGPFILLIERTPADIWLSVIALSFVVRSILLKDGSWLLNFWVRAAFSFWGVCIVSALLSDDLAYSVGESFIWIRFPLFAMATAFWLGRDRRLLNFMLISTAVGILLMCVFLVAELITKGVQPRLSWPYNDLVSGNYLAKVGLPIVVVLMALAASLGNRTALMAGSLSMIIVGMTLMTGERINFLILACGGILASLVWRPNWKYWLVLPFAGSFAIIIVFQIFPEIGLRFVSTFIDHLPTGIESDYYQAMMPAWFVFEKAPLLGIGPGNFRYMCAEIVDAKLGLHCHNHPHNFYFQLLAETGLLGLLFGLIFIGSLTYYCFSAGWRKQNDVVLATSWIIPFAFFWPIRSSADFFGQWNNIFLWSAVALAVAAVHSSRKNIQSVN